METIETGMKEGRKAERKEKHTWIRKRKQSVMGNKQMKTKKIAQNSGCSGFGDDGGVFFKGEIQKQRVREGKRPGSGK
ncbi:hypothetical protein MOSE0_M09516 [Monosporozyma servazzii]